jgi:D-sedoheptulose 7-phosphate isomerase
MSQKIKDIITASIEVKQQVLADEKIITTIKECVAVIVSAFNNGNKVLFCGNGGSAADAQHLAAEFSGRVYIDRDAQPAEAMHFNNSYHKALCNDNSKDVIF